MSEEVLRAYRLTSMEEPTDEMLHAIMEKVAASARISTQKAEMVKQKMLEDTFERIAKRRQGQK